MSVELAPAAQIVAGLAPGPYTKEERLYWRVRALIDAGYSMDDAVRLVAAAEKETATCAA